VVLERLKVQAGERVLLRESTVVVPAGRITVLIGGSGAGKSVLLRIIAGLMPPSGSGVQWSGACQHRNGEPLGLIGIVFQQFALFDELSPAANVQFAIDHRANRAQPPEQSADQWLEELRVPKRLPVTLLSGGQKQRLAIARTLAGDPDVILYDEPTSGLDAASGRQVAQLIRRTQQSHHRTSLVVTHDYDTLIPVADHVLLLDAEHQSLIEVPRDQWNRVAELLHPVRLPEPEAPSTNPWASGGTFATFRSICERALIQIGDAALTTLRLPLDLLPAWRRTGWGLRFTAHYLHLVAGASAWLYLVIAGMIAGFVTSYFTLRFIPFALYTKPLLLEDLIASIGFALYRVLVPVLATVLIAARCGAAVAADVGVKKYGHQTDALQTLGVRPTSYLLTPILYAFLIGTPLLTLLAYGSARITGLATFMATHPQAGPFFWQLHLDRLLGGPGTWWLTGSGWLLVKTLLCGMGTGLIAYWQGIRRKDSAAAVSHGITATVLWSTLYVLVVHFITALFEF
jgi:ABC-type multidrug transport system ATPase subunit/ABC-type transporter Mla maintaining outer membrane lipid asymmetry permease subunit MlaE